MKLPRRNPFVDYWAYPMVDTIIVSNDNGGSDLFWLDDDEICTLILGWCHEERAKTLMAEARQAQESARQRKVSENRAQIHLVSFNKDEME